MNSRMRFAPQVLKASAGTGKTRRLSNRFIGLLAAGELPERILATTFTRKAAGEIFERVLTRLADAALDDGAASALAEEIGGGRVTCKRWGELLAALVAQQHRLNVCTLDSFCVRLATSFGLELGLTPGWRIVQGPEETLLRNDAAAQVLGRAEARELVRLLRLLNAEKVRRSVHQIVLGDIGSGLSLLRDSEAPAWVWRVEDGELAERELAALTQALRNLEYPKNKKGEVNKSWLNEREGTLAALAAADWETLISRGVCAAISSGKSTYSRQEIPAFLRDAYLPAWTHARAVLLNRNARQTAAAYELLTLFDRQLEQLKTAAHAFLFSDIKYRLARSALLGELEPLYYRLDCKIHHLLLDEFQDTSREEWQLVEPIAAEILAQADGERSFFCVGDTKQAIYRWRGGVAEIFDSLTARWSHLEESALSESYRCSPAVIEVVNRVFDDIGDNPALAEKPAAREGAAAWGRRWREHRAARSSLSGYVSFTSVAAAEDDHGRTSGEAVLRDAARIVADIHRRAPGSSIGVLLRSNRNVARMIYELRRPAIGIEASEEGGSALTDAPPVLAVLSLLKLADHPGDSIARFHVAASPLGSALGLLRYDDEDAAYAFAKKIRSWAEFESIGAVVERCVEVLAAGASARDAARLEQLAEAACAYAHEAGPRCGDFVRYVELLKVEDPVPARVRVMTVHQAKGLEFDAVVLPDLEFRLNQNSAQTFLLSQRPTPVEPAVRVMRSPGERVAALDPQRQALVDEELRGLVTEALSVLYVELTRARQGLYLVAAAQRPAAKAKDDEEGVSAPFTYAGIIRSALGIEPTASGAVFEHGDKEWYAAGQPSTDHAGPVVAQAAPRLAPAGARARLLPQRSPSELEGGATIDLALKLDFSRQGSSGRGLLLHRLFEQIEWLGTAALPDDERLAQAAGLRGAFSEDEIRRGLEEFRRMLAHEAVAGVLRRERFGAKQVELWRERRFAVRLDDVLLSGTFDRVVLEWERGKPSVAHLVDFKTDRVGDARAAEERALFYAPQIDAYCRALEKLTGLTRDKIRSSLVFVSAAVVVQDRA